MKRIAFLCVFLGLMTNDLCAQHELAGFLGRWLENGRVNAKKEPLPRVTWLITVDQKTLTLIELSEQGKEIRQIKCNLEGDRNTFGNS